MYALLWEWRHLEHHLKIKHNKNLIKCWVHAWCKISPHSVGWEKGPTPYQHFNFPSYYCVSIRHHFHLLSDFIYCFLITIDNCTQHCVIWLLSIFCWSKKPMLYLLIMNYTLCWEHEGTYFWLYAMFKENIISISHQKSVDLVTKLQRFLSLEVYWVE